MSPGRIRACITILLAVDVPLVTKYVRRDPNARAESSCASRKRSVRLQQRIESAGGRRRFRLENVVTVELAQIANPMRLG